MELVRDKSKGFPELEGIEDTEYLKIWHCKYTDFSSLERAKKLRGLEVASFPEESLDILGSLQNLEYLKILHFPKVTDLSPLTNLKSLRFLGLSTLSNWDASGRKQRVQSFQPILSLKRLEGIELLGVVSDNNDLLALSELPSLNTARIHKHPKAMVKEFFNLSGVANRFIKEWSEIDLTKVST